jgi:lysylphosphatidylglycerol synthetase-like protein (DUF2156 family)
MSKERGSTLKLFAALLLFASAFGSLWFGLTEGPDVLQIRVTYIAAVVLAIIGVIVLMLSTARAEEDGK